ncbi:hypothetical protein ACFPYJ_04150 [Paenibacillus solisilvae]|uniref:Flp pilus-assembly TadG-like N-terminal domain-containing protein n=1 Tax=Paenibacillus solisilvae TaxID=2486751 RepID=A0ABW0VRC4_9BACL
MRKKFRLERFADPNGSVSVFLIIATAGILLFTALLVDYARVAAFQKQIELAAQSGIRSSLSAYDGALYDRYGLFGAGGSDRGELFAHAAENNWEPDGYNHFRLLQIEMSSSHVDSYEVLGTHAVFNRQVLEEMKYKAPIDFTLEVASRFAPIASAMKEASASVVVLEQIRKLYDQREAHLHAILDNQRNAAAAGGAIEPLITGVHAGYSLLSIVSGYSSYIGWRNHDAVLKEGEQPAYTNEISSYVSQASSQAGELVSSAITAAKLHQELEMKSLKELQEAESCDTQMRSIIQQTKQEQMNTGYDRMNKQQLPGNPATAVSEGELSQMQQTKQSLEQLLLSPEWYVNYRRDISDQVVSFSEVEVKSLGFQTSLSSGLSNATSAVELSESLNILQNIYRDYTQRYIRPGVALQVREQELLNRESSDSQRKRKEQAAQSKWNEAKDLLQSMKTVPQKEEHQKQFDDVKKRYEANLHFNELFEDESAAEPDSNLDRDNGDAHEAAEASMSAMGNIFAGMADMLDNIRDPLYMNEYIVHRFTAFNPLKFKAILQSADRSEFADALSLNNQEVEYVLYGFHQPAANVSAAYGEIFATRLAIRTMEGLIECRSLGHPLLVLAAALLYGLEKTMEDMVSLSQKGTTPLSKYAAVDLTYLDYLRLFLLLHGSDEQRISRTIAVIEQNTGLTLTKTSTGLSGELTASVNLWFLPGLMKSFTRFNILKGKVKGNRYETTKTIGWSYG